MKELIPVAFPHVMGYNVSGVVFAVGEGTSAHTVSERNIELARSLRADHDVEDDALLGIETAKSAPISNALTANG